jgi:hypothetical protein
MLATAGRRALLAAGALALVTAVVPPAGAAPEVRRVIVGRESYDTSGFHEMWFGKGYRDEWTTPIEMPVLDLASFGGGLAPVRTVGNMQSIGLALKGKDGKSYTFRTMDKDPTRILPAQWRKTWPARIFQDQTVANYPGTPYVVPALAEAAGVPHTAPQVVFMPDAPELGQFRKVFGGTPGTIDEYPLPTSDAGEGFLGASEIVSAGKLWERWLAGDVDVDAERYLRARMLDIVIGDWDRHNGQVRFLRNPGHPAWLALPEDRDQAFSDFSGVMLGMARQTMPRLLKWDDDYENMRGLLFQGAELDRWILTGTERVAFTRAAREVMDGLTDQAIADAVRRLPPEWYALRGEQLITDLRHRRDLLPKAAEKFYENLAGMVDVRGTDQPDHVRLQRDEDGNVLLEIRADRAGEPWFRRRFLKSETKEIRLYLHGGVDSITTWGPRGGIKVRVSGGPGFDQLDDSHSGGTRFYDVEDRAEVTRGPGTSVSTAEWDAPPYKKETPWLERIDYGGTSPRAFLLWWEPDPGIVLSASRMWFRNGFRKQPFAQTHRVAIEYKTARQAFAVMYDGDYRWTIPGFSTSLEMYADGAKNYNFFGFGSDTVLEGDDEHYEALQKQYYAFPSLVTFSSPTKPFKLRLGPEVKFAQDASEEGSFINQNRPYGFGDFGQLGGRLNFEMDTRRTSMNTTMVGVGMAQDAVPKQTGVKIEFDGTVYPKAWDVEETFGAVEGSVAGYWGALHWLTLAGQVGGRHVMGKHPWHESAFLGGSPDVRGYDRNRFAGHTSLYTNAEARISLGVSGLFLPTRWGVLAIADGGTVWADDAPSGTWRPGYGGGIWVQLLNLPMTGYGAIVKGKGEEGVKFYANYGFAF